MNIDTSIKQVIIMRTDLNMSCGKKVAQGAHGAVMGVLSLPSDNKYRRAWLKGGMTKITVKCNSLDELNTLEEKAKELSIPVVKVVDAGLTEFDGVPTETCIVLGPYLSDEINRITGKLKLL